MTIQRVECDSFSSSAYYFSVLSNEDVIIESTNEHSVLHAVLLLSQGAYRQAMVDKILGALKAPPIASFTSIEDANTWLDTLSE